MKTAESFLESDISINKEMGRFGADNILQKYDNQAVRILTHCNTGSLATGGYGTALGICISQITRLLCE